MSSCKCKSIILVQAHALCPAVSHHIISNHAYAKQSLHAMRCLATRNAQQKYLREMLQEIARMHTSGPHRNCWELKPEFKTSGEAPGGGAEGGDAKEPEKDA